MNAVKPRGVSESQIQPFPIAESRLQGCCCVVTKRSRSSTEGHRMECIRKRASSAKHNRMTDGCCDGEEVEVMVESRDSRGW